MNNSAAVTKRRHWLRRVKTKLKVLDTYGIRKPVVTVFGVTVILLGVAMIVFPGPAILVIPAGLAILALEYAWARRWLKKVKRLARSARQKFSKQRSS